MSLTNDQATDLAKQAWRFALDAAEAPGEGNPARTSADALTSMALSLAVIADRFAADTPEGDQ